MFNLLLLLVSGIIETFLFTWWNLSANEKQLNKSTILMTVYMMVYLIILKYCFEEKNGYTLIIIYSIACGIGNYLELLWETRRGK